MAGETEESAAVQVKCIRCNVDGERVSGGEFVCPDCGGVLAQSGGASTFELRTYAGP